MTYGMRVIRSVTRSLDSLTYLVVSDSGEAVMIDAGAGAFLRAAYYLDRGYGITNILITHGHFDHVCDAGRVRSLTGAPIVMVPTTSPSSTSPRTCVGRTGSAGTG